eukprot:NODE_3202_length_1401_cov_32.657277_g2784_i0.p1 GENE.NODE_3202_length_1401_cov_32.657277_g2784_i0~~NODE_3202_length_1401_cov_32.657277_g2784_i0.p1  ORF type:complete len:422 (+),score=88.29 NODE_3202_length_1401_cov_32.657277_g2784_i0:75-1340(+)
MKPTLICVLLLLSWPLCGLTLDTFTPIADACCCSKEDVDNTLHETLVLLNRLVQRPYFRYWKANLERPCPYWAVELMCGAAAGGGPAPCNVCSCDENEVPIALRHDSMCGLDPFSSPPPQQVTLDVDHTVGDGLQQWDDSSTMWFYEDSSGDPNAVYIDLVRNPEANTGYTGDSAKRVWMAIYSENCFIGDFTKMCMPERAFYRLVSGLHASISTQISAKFYQKGVFDANRPETFQWDPNPTLFMKIVGNFADRIDNLYYLYLFVLRALTKAKPYLMTGISFNTGNELEDQLTRQELKDLLATKLVCTPTFNESLLFVGIPDKSEVLRQMRNNFNNITRLMDCLSCEKCRLWGKLETIGIAAAMKIVIENVPVTSLQRSEVVAMVNLLKQLSSSIDHVRTLLKATTTSQSQSASNLPSFLR